MILNRNDMPLSGFIAREVFLCIYAFENEMFKNQTGKMYALH